MSGHSILPPSSAGIWGKPDGCTAWPMQAQCYPEVEPHPEAAIGDASHEIGAKLIKQSAVGSNARNWSQFEETLAANDLEFTEDMFDGAVIYADDVAEVMRSTGCFVPHVEGRIAIPGIHEVQFGTPDCWLFDKSMGRLYFWDYKFGHRDVLAFENWQGVNYLAGILPTLGVPDLNITVHLRIVKPRVFHSNGPIDEWVVPAVELRGYFNQLHAAAHEAMGVNAVCRTGSHCRDCTARYDCTPAIHAGLGLYELAMKPTPMELTPQALGLQLAIVSRGRKQLEYLESALEEQVKGLIKTGKPVPGWEAEPSFGRETWAKPIDEVIALGKLLGKDLRKDGAKTPNQARTLGIDDAVISAYSETPRTGLKLVPDNGNKTRQVFMK